VIESFKMEASMQISANFVYISVTLKLILNLFLFLLYFIKVYSYDVSDLVYYKNAGCIMLIGLVHSQAYGRFLCFRD